MAALSTRVHRHSGSGGVLETPGIGSFQHEVQPHHLRVQVGGIKMERHHRDRLNHEGSKTHAYHPSCVRRMARCLQEDLWRLGGPILVEATKAPRPRTNSRIALAQRGAYGWSGDTTGVKSKAFPIAEQMTRRQPNRPSRKFARARWDD